MPRKRTGAVEFRGGCWHARVTQNDGSRPWIAMPGIPKDDEATARAVAAEMSIQAKNAVPASRGESVSKDAETPSIADESTRNDVLNRPTGNRSHGAESSLESALSKAILLAAQAGEWETVQVLTHELSARRRAATGVRSDLEAVPSPKERRPSK